MEATTKPSIKPTTTTQAMTEPNLHQLITRTTPPRTPTTAARARRTVERRVRRSEVRGQKATRRAEETPTVVVQVCGPRDQHEQEERCEAEAHAEQFCGTEERQSEWAEPEYQCVWNQYICYSTATVLQQWKKHSSPHLKNRCPKKQMKSPTKPMRVKNNLVDTFPGKNKTEMNRF